jgi:hypothetical protein
MTVLDWCFWDQWLLPRAMAMWEVSMPQKSSWDRLRGEKFRDHMGTLGGEGLHVIGVTTLRSKGELVVSRVWIVVCDLVRCGGGMGAAKIGLDDSARHGRGLILGGAAGGVAG